MKLKTVRKQRKLECVSVIAHDSIMVFILQVSHLKERKNSCRLFVFTNQCTWLVNWFLIIWIMCIILMSVMFYSG